MTTALVRFIDIDIPQPNKDCFFKRLCDLGWMYFTETRDTYVKEINMILPRVQYKKMIKDDIREAALYAVLTCDVKYRIAVTEERDFITHAMF
jgi:hypothetical protein